MIYYTINELQKILNIINDEKINLGEIEGSKELIKKRCGLNSVNDTYQNFLEENDVIIFPTIDNSLNELGDDILTAGQFCLITNDFRIVGGVLKINPNITFTKNNSDTYFKYVLLHEFTHILIFHPSIMELLDMIEKDKETDQLIVKSPIVLEKAKEHFNCEFMKGVKLEDEEKEGIAGYHWDSRYMLGDYMISIDYIDIVISDITLALFEDSGFYKVNYYTGGLFKFGKNKGCKFIDKKCNLTDPTFKDEFCYSPGIPKCSQSRISKGICTLYNYSLNNLTIDSSYQYFEDPGIGGLKQIDYCPVTDYYDNQSSNYYYSQNCQMGNSSNLEQFKEKIGNNSFCFIISWESNDFKNNSDFNKNDIDSNNNNNTNNNTNISNTTNSLRHLNSNSKVENKAVCYQTECNNDTKVINITIGNQNILCENEGEISIKIDNNITAKINCPNYYDICGFNNNSCNEIFDCIDKGVAVDYNSFIYEPKEYSKFLISNFYFKILLLILIILN